MLQQHRRLGMGTYVNPGRNNFQMSVNSEIFVDKTEMIAFLNTLVNTQQRYASVSRPRRFGKSMAVDMLCAYYDRGLTAGKYSRRENWPLLRLLRMVKMKFPGTLIWGSLM